MRRRFAKHRFARRRLPQRPLLRGSRRFAEVTPATGAAVAGAVLEPATTLLAPEAAPAIPLAGILPVDSEAPALGAATPPTDGLAESRSSASKEEGVTGAPMTGAVPAGSAATPATCAPGGAAAAGGGVLPVGGNEVPRLPEAGLPGDVFVDSLFFPGLVEASFNAPAKSCGAEPPEAGFVPGEAVWVFSCATAGGGTGAMGALRARIEEFMSKR